MLSMESGVNQQEAQSIFVMGSFEFGPYQGVVYKVNLDNGQSSEASGGAEDHSNLPVLDPVLKFFDKTVKLRKYCLFQGARYGSKFFLMANGRSSSSKPVKTINSFVFDTKLGSDLQQFSPSKAGKPYGDVISAYGMLYYFAHPSSFTPEPSFERYNLTCNVWESLPSYPCRTLPVPSMKVIGYAVCYGYILISLYNSKEYAILAFHIGREEWHKVTVTNSTKAAAASYFPIMGRAVVVDNIIYASSFIPDKVIAFSFWRDSYGNCYLSTPVLLKVMDMLYHPSRFEESITQNMVHLGKLDFCLILTGRNRCSLERQYLCVTRFRIIREGGEMHVKTICSSVFQVRIMGGVFRLHFSFAPDCEDIEPEEQYCPTKDEIALASFLFQPNQSLVTHPSTSEKPLPVRLSSVKNATGAEPGLNSP